MPALAGFKLPGRVEKLFYPVGFFLVAQNTYVFARRHCQQVVNGHLLKFFIRLFRFVFGKEVDYLCVKRAETLVNEKAHRYRNKTLAYRIHCVRNVGRVGSAPAFVCYFAVTDNLNGMHLVVVCFKVLNERLYLF